MGIAFAKGRMIFGVALLIGVATACTTSNRPDLSGMSFSSEPLVGKVIWHDLITHDLDAVRRFYGGLFGWTFENTFRADGREYVLARSGNVYVAGLVPIPRPGDEANYSRWLPYISVADVDQAVSRSESAGATLAAAPRDVNLGRVAAIVDPEGAVIGLASSDVGDPDDLTTAPAPGRVVWTELLANDPDAEEVFYKSVVGYSDRDIQRRGAEYTFLTNDGVDRVGIMKNPNQEWEPVWLTYFAVNDPSRSAARAVELGGRLILDVSPDLREGSMAVVADPSGAILILQQWPM